MLKHKEPGLQKYLIALQIYSECGILQQNMGAETAGSKPRFPTLALIREQLAANPNVIVVSERTEDWTFKGDDEGTLEFINIRVAPAEAIKEPVALNDFMDGLFTGVDSRRFQRTAGRLNFFQTPGDNAFLFILPRLVFFETLGTVQETTVATITRALNAIYDRETLARHDKLVAVATVRTEEKREDIIKYSRGVEICVYPDRAIAELYARYEPQRSIDVNKFPPGTQKDLEHLWNSLTPQLYRRWLAGEDLASFYFTPEGKFIPRFYQIPAHMIRAIMNSRPEGAFLPDGDFTEVFRVVDGSETGARIMLWRTYKNFIPERLVDRMYRRYRSRGENIITARHIRLIEQGVIEPTPEVLDRIYLVIGIMGQELQAVQIFPEGYIPVSNLPQLGDFSNLIRAYRLDRRLTQETLGQKIGLTQAMMSLIESGQYQFRKVKPKLVDDLIIALGLDEQQADQLRETYKKQFNPY